MVRRRPAKTLLRTRSISTVGQSVEDVIWVNYRRIWCMSAITSVIYKILARPLFIKIILRKYCVGIVSQHMCEKVVHFKELYSFLLFQ